MEHSNNVIAQKPVSTNGRLTFTKLIMKSKHQTASHNSGSPAKRRRILSTLSSCVHQLTMNVQRTNPFQCSSRQEQTSGEYNQLDGFGTPVDTRMVDGSPLHGQEYPLSTAMIPSHQSPPILPPRAPENRFSDHHFNNHMSLLTPRTPSPRSWNLTSPPKPRRVASTGMPPFAVSQGGYSYPVQARYAPRQPQVPRNIRMSTMTLYHQVVGDPSLKIFRVRLPPHLLHLLDGIVIGCEAHAATLPNGWLTDLYSLTKQDIALRKIPHLYEAAKPIISFMKRSILALFGVHSLRMDKNQPHVLKYSKEDGHTGVELHHDKCDVTANLCMSRSSSYVGGG